MDGEYRTAKKLQTGLETKGVGSLPEASQQATRRRAFAANQS
jgi:hypothetical protein